MTRGMTDKELKYQINALRFQLHMFGSVKGLKHPKTVEISLQLDMILNAYQQNKLKGDEKENTINK